MNHNPFFSAYFQSDFLGKTIFWALFLVSMITWVVLLHKIWLLFHIKKASALFKTAFSEKDPLNLHWNRPLQNKKVINPFFEIYKSMKQSALFALSKNQQSGIGTLTDTDFNIIEAQVYQTVELQSEMVEKNLFVLSTSSSLAPFLGLLGTVWGILLTFAQIQEKGGLNNSSSMLGGLALALATTVAGLVIAIPALVGYNYLKNVSAVYRRQMEWFATHMITALEQRYRSPNYEKIQTPK